jgi:hypothetical protein
LTWRKGFEFLRPLLKVGEMRRMGGGVEIKIGEILFMGVGRK